VTIRRTTWQPQSRTCQSRNLHTSGIGRILPVCVGHNRRRGDRIFKPRAKFGESGKKLCT